MGRKMKKEYTDWWGVRSSFLATVACVKSIWEYPPEMAVDWYIERLGKQHRYRTVETALVYREALEDEYEKWINKNVVPKAPKPVVQPENLAVTRAKAFLESKGYTVTK